MPQTIENILDSIKQVSLSSSVLDVLMDFERVLDDMNLYSFLNWKYGELVQGPDITRYRVACTFMWPYSKMPDPAGAQRLLPYGAKIGYKKEWLTYPIKISSEADYRPGIKKPKLAKTRVWLVDINLPSHLIKDITRGSEDIMGREIDLEDIDDAYEQGLDHENASVTPDTEETDQQPASEIGGGGGF